MTGISITPEEVQLARGATFLDDLDMIISPYGGHLVPVAMKNGLHVCWGCGEPFDPDDKHKALVEMRPPGAAVPIGMHRSCVNRKARVSVFDTLKGFELRRTMAKVAKPLIAIEKKISAEVSNVAGKIFGVSE